MRFRRLAVVALALVGLTGCGQESAATLTRVHDFTAYGGKAPASAKQSNGPVAADLWAKTLATFTACKSVRIDGTIPSGTSTATVTLAGTCDGSNARAQTTTEAESFEVITVSGTYYVKANTTFWRATGFVLGAQPPHRHPTRQARTTNRGSDSATSPSAGGTTVPRSRSRPVRVASWAVARRSVRRSPAVRRTGSTR